jgi:hypothetical protein
MVVLQFTCITILFSTGSYMIGSLGHCCPVGNFSQSSEVHMRTSATLSRALTLHILDTFFLISIYKIQVLFSWDSIAI